MCEEIMSLYDIDTYDYNVNMNGREVEEREEGNNPVERYQDNERNFGGTHIIRWEVRAL